MNACRRSGNSLARSVGSKSMAGRPAYRRAAPPKRSTSCARCAAVASALRAARGLAFALAVDFALLAWTWSWSGWRRRGWPPPCPPSSPRSPADFAAVAAPVTAARAPDAACAALPAASLRCLVDADFLPAVEDDDFCWLRLRVAAAFLAAADRSALVLCAIGLLLSPCRWPADARTLSGLAPRRYRRCDRGRGRRAAAEGSARGELRVQAEVARDAPHVAGLVAEHEGDPDARCGPRGRCGRRGARRRRGPRARRS